MAGVGSRSAKERKVNWRQGLIILLIGWSAVFGKVVYSVDVISCGIYSIDAKINQGIFTMDANYFYAWVRTSTGLKRQGDIADVLGVAQGTLSGWLNDRGLPKDYQQYIDLVCDKYKVDPPDEEGGDELDSKHIMEIFLQINAKMDTINRKIDDHIVECKREMEGLKKALGECGLQRQRKKAS